MASRFPSKLEYGNVTLVHTYDEVYTIFHEEFIHEFTQFAETYGLIPVEDNTTPFRFASKSETVKARWWKTATETNVENQLNLMLSDPRVQLASPVYHRKDLLPRKTGITFSDVILVKVRFEDSSASIDQSFENFGDIIGKPIKLMNANLYRLRIKDPKIRNALAVSNEIVSLSSIVTEAQPDWICLTPIFNMTPNDKYFRHQWALRRIEAPEGWEVSNGSPNVVIAIIDSGCDLNHEDLRSKYVPEAERYNVLDGTNEPHDVFGHGTCIAGIAAAHSNNHVGVAGVAWNCKIMPIKLSKDDGSSTTQHDAVLAIDWAINHRANVINMSWTWPPPNDMISSILEKAHSANIILVASASNYYVDGAVGPVAFPANHPSVIAVGASDENDKRKSFASADGQCWGSNYGNGLSVMAPGVRIMTTDITGRAGFNDQIGIFPRLCISGSYGPNYDYCSVMGGTSGAAALVSGLAALLLSYCPLLSSEQVRTVIERTAEKVGHYSYRLGPMHPNGSWNKEMGYGRINILRAIRFVNSILKPKLRKTKAKKKY